MLKNRYKQTPMASSPFSFYFYFFFFPMPSARVVKRELPKLLENRWCNKQAEYQKLITLSAAMKDSSRVPDIKCPLQNQQGLAILILSFAEITKCIREGTTTEEMETNLDQAASSWSHDYSQSGLQSHVLQPTHQYFR